MHIQRFFQTLSHLWPFYFLQIFQADHQVHQTPSYFQGRVKSQCFHWAQCTPPSGFLSPLKFNIPSHPSRLNRTSDHRCFSSLFRPLSDGLLPSCHLVYRSDGKMENAFAIFLGSNSVFNHHLRCSFDVGAHSNHTAALVWLCGGCQAYTCLQGGASKVQSLVQETARSNQAGVPLILASNGYTW